MLQSSAYFENSDFNICELIPTAHTHHYPKHKSQYTVLALASTFNHHYSLNSYSKLNEVINEVVTIIDRKHLTMKSSIQ